jgi:hypothetical protein
MQSNGLNLGRIRKYYGGKQPVMRPSINLNANCFGKYHDETYNLQPGMTQSMVFEDNDSGPFYMNKEERERRKSDIKTGKFTTRNILKSELAMMLQEMGMANPSGSAKQLQKRCQLLNLPITRQEEIIEEGWVNKPKGAFQVLYERGWIDPLQTKQYTEKGRCDEMGILIEESSINLLMQKQPDFAFELTLLQYYGSELGVLVDRTPKCHPEIAGDGIEYVWALAKLYYRYQPLSMKRSKDQFRRLVNDSLSTKNLTLGRVRKCSKRARDYMLAYSAFESVSFEMSGTPQLLNGIRNGTDCSGRMKLNLDLIEKTMKVFKTHRNARDFDVKFIRKLGLNEENLNFVKGVVTKMKVELG